VDGDYALEPILPSVSPAAATGEVAITVTLPADAVCLLRLTQPAE
jgi:hypothetical protein